MKKALEKPNIREKTGTPSARLGNIKGASITVALLFFILCAVIGSVVLTAGTAAAGRVRRLAEGDRSYRCVLSAAETLRDLIDGRQTEVLRTRLANYTVTSEYQVDEDGVASRTSEQPVESEKTYSYNFSIDGASFTLRDNLLWDAAISLIFGQKSTDAGKWENEYGVTEEVSLSQFTVTPVDFEPKTAVTVTAKLLSLTAGNVMQLTLTDGTTTFTINCQAQVSEDLSVHTETSQLSVNPPDNTGKYHRVDAVTDSETKQAVIRWTVTSLRSE
ncbi:MAG: hypothetical protein IJU75_03380 [Clostridia bacterium]|nr:hypothetical protein [Clostridia bacterium]